MTLKDLLQAIAHGDLDEHEREIANAFRLRQTTKLKVGTRVKLHQISPAWLNDRTAKIIGLPRNPKSQRFDVELEQEPDILDRFGRQEGKLQRGVPASCLLPVD